MRLRQAQMKTPEAGNWFIWSVNSEDRTVSCLPYNDIEGDTDSFFVHDLKHFPMDEVLNANAAQH
ncbi:MAG: hypothetical protein BGO63_03880 [Candidatus Accumulibacter sp. 66-26]|nr:MAG: hypothetical protein BGO63_03880 [Candidatus Accumulibacter sp. 66-26]